MEPLPSPTTPRSPISPTFSHPLETGTSNGRMPPRLQVMTNIPFQQMLQHSSLSQTSSPSAIEYPSAFRHRRNMSSMSLLAFSPATEAILSQPLTALPTPLTPRGPLYPTISQLPSPRGLDGRQSRMSIRSPLPPPLHSPILERIVSLPLRSANKAAFPEAVPAQEAQNESASAEHLVSEGTYTRWRPWTPVHSRAPAISFPPSRSQSRSQRRTSSTTRSGSIKKRTRSPPPKYHVTVLPTLFSQQLAGYNNVITHLSTPLVPLISVTTGFPHPEFPRSLLQYHLLTHDQLDSLARWYHQVEPSVEESWMYPAWIPPYARRAASASARANQPQSQTGSGGDEGGGRVAGITLTTKRRRWGRFIGLRGCESPEGVDDEEEQESLVERMEREWRRAMERMREEEIAREKGWRGRW